jgi:hypothetical protein
MSAFPYAMEVTMKKLALAIFAAAVLPAAALAQSAATFPGDVANTIRFRFGGIYANLGSEVTYSTPTFPGGDIDLSKVFGDRNKFGVRAEGFWNFAGRSYLDFGYVRFSRMNSASITRDINFGGVIYTAGAQVTAESLSRFIYASYRYGIVKTPNFQVGLSLGVSYTTLSASLSASGGVTQPNGTPISGTVIRESKINAPIPLLGIEADGKIMDNVSAGIRFRAFGATIAPYKGNAEEVLGHVDWYFNNNFGMGGAYEWTHIDLTKTQDTKTLGFNYRYNGPRVYVIVTF